MQELRIVIPDRTTELQKQELVCKGFGVDFTTQRIVPVLEIQMQRRTASEAPVLDEQGQPTGATTTTYGEWQTDRRYSPSGAISIQTESSNSKLIDPVTFEIVEPGTEGAVGEIDAIWALFGPGIEQLLSTLMNRMIGRGIQDRPFES